MQSAYGGTVSPDAAENGVDALESVGELFVGIIVDDFDDGALGFEFGAWRAGEDDELVLLGCEDGVDDVGGDG